MSNFKISDLSPAGAYVNAIMAAQNSDRRDADRRSESREGLTLTKFLATLVRRIAAAVTERRPAKSRPSSRPV